MAKAKCPQFEETEIRTVSDRNDPEVTIMENPRLQDDCGDFMSLILNGHPKLFQRGESVPLVPHLRDLSSRL